MIIILENQNNILYVKENLPFLYEYYIYFYN